MVFHTIGQSLYIIEAVLLPSALSSHQDLSVEDKKVKEGRQTIFFALLTPFGEHSDEGEHSDHFSRPRKVHCVSNWKTFFRTPSIG